MPTVLSGTGNFIYFLQQRKEQKEQQQNQNKQKNNLTKTKQEIPIPGSMNVPSSPHFGILYFRKLLISAD